VNSQATLVSPRLNDIVGPQNVICDAQTLSAYAVDGMIPKAAARPGTAQEVSELVKFAAAENLAIIPTGARTKLGIGMPPARYDLAIDMTRLDRVISYDPGDLTLSVEPGIPLARLATILAEHNQFLPLDVPFFERATVGGTLASGVDSPLRHAYGTPRDFVLGMEFVVGNGSMAKSGGRVVKNVTGYDLHKLMLGAIGSLGVITRVNFKTFPRPVGMRTWAAGFARLEDATEFSQGIRQSALAPSSLDLLSSWSQMDAEIQPHAAWLVTLSAGGSEAVLERYSRELWRIAEATHARSMVTLTDELRERQWAQLRELPQIEIRKRHSVAVFRAAVLPSQIGAFLSEVTALSKAAHCMAAILGRASGTVYVVLEPSDVIENALERLRDACKRLFDLAAKMDSPATIPWCPPELKRELSIWGPPREDFPLMQRVKQAFDPQNIFAPGRFVGGL
jgi:glycolate oxidase FAD binding subunit